MRKRSLISVAICCFTFYPSERGAQGVGLGKNGSILTFHKEKLRRRERKDSAVRRNMSESVKTKSSKEPKERFASKQNNIFADKARKGANISKGSSNESIPNDHPTSLPTIQAVIPPRSEHASSPNHHASKPKYYKKKSIKSDSRSMKHVAPTRPRTPKPTSKGKGAAPTIAPVSSPTRNPMSPSTVTHSPSVAPVSPPSPPGDCISPVMAPILDSVPEAFAQTPERCCNFAGPTAAIITHGFRDDSTPSNFEIFWDEMYLGIAETSRDANVCFFMTGVDLRGSSKTLSEVLVDVLEKARNSTSIPSIMVTDPTDNVELIETIRSISDNPQQASIGVFNAGYINIVTESIITGRQALPFVGYQDDRDYGIEAGEATVTLLNGTEAIPLCFNARIGVVDLIGERCSAYYATVTSSEIVPEIGIPCSVNSTGAELLDHILTSNANAVWSHVDCCNALGEAAEFAGALGRTIVAGCQDFSQKENTAGLNFITTQPIDLQAYQTSLWANLPVQQELAGNDGRSKEYFPDLDSFINTAIFNIIL